MSELTDIKKSLDDLTRIVTTHIAATDEYRKSKDASWKAMTDAIWDKDGNPGALTKLDRLIQKDNQRTWVMRVVYAAVAGLGLERVFHFFKP
jgi:hypothetical protein